MSFRLTPVILNLASKCGGRVVAHVEGVSVQHLLPVEEHNIRLIIPRASPVPALRSMARDSSKVLICFDRARLIASIRASLAAGVIEADSAIEVALVAEGDALVGTASLRVHQKNER